jgi:hypothetical protein
MPGGVTTAKHTAQGFLYVSWTRLAARFCIKDKKGCAHHSMQRRDRFPIFDIKVSHMKMP